MDLRLSGKTALITGSYRGTGAGIAKVMAAEGASVLVHGLKDGQPDEVVQQISMAGGAAQGVVADIRQPHGVNALGKTLERVDVLVANHGAPVGSRWDKADMAAWAEEWNNNVLVGISVAQEAMLGMRERGWGRIIFLGTVGTRMPGQKNPGYYAAKAGLPVLVRSLAVELRGSGVTANLVSPGMIATAEVREMLTRRAARHDVGPGWLEVQAWAATTAMPNLTERIAEPEDIGSLVAYLASEAAWHINGADLAIDGGAVDAR